MLGVREVGAWIGGGVAIRPVLPAMLACWSLVCIIALLFGAVRIRSEPISERFSRQAVILPMADRRLIRPYLGAGLQIMLPLAFTGLGLFFSIGYFSDWHLLIYVRVTLCVLLSVLCTWLLAEWIAARLLTSQAVISTAIFCAVTLVIVLFAFAGVARDRPELNNELGYGAIFMLPPSGWFLPVSGLLSWPGIRGWLTPVMGAGLICLTWRSLHQNLWLSDIRLPSTGKVTAYRMNWARPIPKSLVSGQLFKKRETEEKCRWQSNCESKDCLAVRGHSSLGY